MSSGTARGAVTEEVTVASAAESIALPAASPNSSGGGERAVSWYVWLLNAERTGVEATESTTGPSSPSAVAGTVVIKAALTLVKLPLLRRSLSSIARVRSLHCARRRSSARDSDVVARADSGAAPPVAPLSMARLTSPSPAVVAITGADAVCDARAADLCGPLSLRGRRLLRTSLSASADFRRAADVAVAAAAALVIFFGFFSAFGIKSRAGEVVAAAAAAAGGALLFSFTADAVAVAPVLAEKELGEVVRHARETVDAPSGVGSTTSPPSIASW